MESVAVRATKYGGVGTEGGRELQARCDADPQPLWGEEDAVSLSLAERRSRLEHRRLRRLPALLEGALLHLGVDRAVLRLG